MERPNLKNKKILITQSALHFLAGSEITTLELATFFKACKAKVIVFTWFLDNPMKQEFEKKQIEVTMDENDIRLTNTDIAWIHHQVIPKRLLDNLQKKTDKPTFYFFHMSPLDILPIEHPYLCNLESKIASKSFFSSEGTKDSLIRLFPSLKEKACVLENLLPEDFYNYTHKPTVLKKILIVSNHPPKELQIAASILRQQGFLVDYLGQTSQEKLITVEVLAQYDLVVTIGKTVIYCLGANIPVYIYDHFGGPGFLSNKNFAKTRYRTFSGRGFRKKTPEQIIHDLKNNYQNAIIYQQNNLNCFRSFFSINNQLIKLLPEQVNSHPISYEISDEQFNTVSAILGLVNSKVTSENLLLSTQHKNDLLKQKLEETEKNYENIVNSKRYKLISKIADLIH